MAVHTDDRTSDVGHFLFQVANAVGELIRHRVTDGIGDVHRARSRFDGLFHDLGEKVELGASRVFRRELDVVAQLSREFHALDSSPHDLFFGHRKLELPVNRTRRKKHVDPCPRRLFQRLPGTVDIELVATCEARDNRSFNLLRNFSNRFKVTIGCDWKARLDDIHPKLGERLRHYELARQIHARTRRLLTVSQGGVENDDTVRICHSGLSPKHIETRLLTVITDRLVN